MPAIPWIVAGGLFGAAFVAPWISLPWLLVPAGLVACKLGGASGRARHRVQAATLALLAALANCALVAGATAQGLRIDPGGFDATDFRISQLLPDIPLHDAWAVDLKGGPSPALEELGNTLRRMTPLQSSPAVLALGGIREVAVRALGIEDERWAVPDESFVLRLTGHDRERSTTEPGTTVGIWRILFAFPREGAAETMNGTAHVAVDAAVQEGPKGARLFLSFWVRDVNWTTPFYMRLIDPARRYFLYPFLLRQFAHTWEQEGWKPHAEQPLIGEGP